MLLKWIVCDVLPENRRAFHEAQLAWRSIRDASGLVAQVGGWSVTSYDACILSVWEDGAGYGRFREHLHDAIVDRNAQSLTYDSIDVSHANVTLPMGGEAASLGDAAERARLLRVADCRVDAARRDRFIQSQREIWEPGMAATTGQLGGAFSEVEGDAERFLVTTLWRDEESHECYVEERLPRLRARARPNEDLSVILGWRVRLVTEWAIIPGSAPP